MLLAIDTSTQNIGIALYDGNKVLSELSWTSRNYHTIEVAPAVIHTLNRTNFGVADVECLAVAKGPGSFTGLRIGMAFIKGLAISRKLPIVGIPSLDILAAAQPLDDIEMLAVLKAGRNRYAVASYQAIDGEWLSTKELKNLDIHELKRDINDPVFIVGELENSDRELLIESSDNCVLASPAQSLRRASYLAEIAWKKYCSGKTDDLESLVPIYLQKGDSIPI